VPPQHVSYQGQGIVEAEGPTEVGEASMEDMASASPCWGEELEFDFVGVIYR
jgi:hypothetical protein